MQLGNFDVRSTAHEKVELAFLGSHFSDVEVEVPDRIALERLPGGLVTTISGNRLIPWRLKHRCRDDRVKCGIVACRA
jgi:hypothetical protein